MTKSYQDFDQQFKIVMIGNSGVGKSSIIVRFVDDHFKDDLLSTVGVDFRFRTFHVQDKKIKMQIWDTAGQQNFRTIISSYYRGADAIIVVYDTSQYNTFAEISKFWSKQVLQNKETDCEVVLIGNKIDKTGLKKPSEQQIQRLKSELKSQLYFQISAKTAQSVEDAFINITKKLLKKKKNTKKSKHETLGTNNRQKKRNYNQSNGCC